jgi:hypothetical protein
VSIRAGEHGGVYPPETKGAGRLLLPAPFMLLELFLGYRRHLPWMLNCDLCVGGLVIPI